MPLTKSQLGSFLNYPETILDDFPEIIIVYDSDNNITWTNKAANDTLKSNSPHLIGKKCHEIWCLNQKSCKTCVINTAIVDGNVTEKEKRFMKNRIFSIKAIPVKEKNNVVVGAIGYFRDITSEKKKNEEIIQSREELKLLVEHQNELIIKIDHEHRFLYVSKSYQELYGHSPSDLTGKDIYRFVEQEDKVFLKRTLDNLRRKNKTDAYAEIRESTLEGVKWIGWSYKPVMDESGKCHAFVGIGRDITEKKHVEHLLKKKNKDYKALNQELKLQNYNYEKLTSELVKRNNEIQNLYQQLKDSEERFRTMFMKHSSIMYLIDPETKVIINANEAAIKFYGYSTEELIGSYLDKILVKEDDRKKETKFKNAHKSNPVQSRHKLSNGRIREVEVHSMPIRIEYDLFEFAIVYDITKRNKAERKLALSEKKLRQANQAKDKFFSIIAHDLKNPFNALIGLSDYLVRNLNKIEHTRVMDIIKNINQVSNQSYALLESLLQWSRTQSGTMSLSITAVSLNELIMNNMSLISEAAKAKEIDMVSDLPDYFYVWADKNMIDTVIRNLLNNAVKFTYRGGKVRVSVRKTGKQVWLTVKDNGQGMSEKQINSLFSIDSNYTTPGTEKEKGTGLGLIVCKEFIEKCRGKIEVESELKKGSTFNVKLKAYEA